MHQEDSGQVEKYSERFLGDGLRYEIRDFLARINGSSKNDFKLRREESIAIAGIMEKFLQENRNYEDMGAQRMQPAVS